MGDGGEQVHPETEAGPMGDGETKPKEGVTKGFSKMTNKLRKVSFLFLFLRWVDGLLMRGVESGLYDDCEYAE